MGEQLRFISMWKPHGPQSDQKHHIASSQGKWHYDWGSKGWRVASGYDKKPWVRNSSLTKGFLKLLCSRELLSTCDIALWRSEAEWLTKKPQLCIRVLSCARNSMCPSQVLPQSLKDQDRQVSNFGKAWEENFPVNMTSCKSGDCGARSCLEMPLYWK